MMEGEKIFEFKECVHLIKATGKKAGNLREFKEMISVVPDESILHHTSQYFIQSRVLEYTNDFAQWAGESLGERVLAEHLSSVDPYTFRSVDGLRKELLDVVDAYLDKFPEPRDTLPGNEFYFNLTVTLIFPAGIRARNLAEFLMAVKYVNVNSIYYHFYEARVRGWSGVDDFSVWLEASLGREKLAAQIRSIDPFMHDTERIRARLIKDIENELGREMEVL